jgi:ubiquinone/menaquinone biosynthesis C-methylase UbiE
MKKTEIRKFFDKAAPQRDKWRRRNRYYHQEMERLLGFFIPQASSVLDIGCATGDLLASLKPAYGVGVDISSGMVKVARSKHKSLRFEVMDVEKLDLEELFQFVVLSDLVGFLDDIQAAFSGLHKVSNQKTRVIITWQNYLWEPLFRLASFLRLRMKQPIQNWLSSADIESMLYLAGFEVVRRGESLLFPKYIPLFSTFCNRFLAKLPLIRRLCVVKYLVARKQPQNQPEKNPSISIIIPARNEKGNIEEAVKRVPNFLGRKEIIFVEGHSKDDTWQEILRVKKQYRHLDIKAIIQDGKGKGDAVRKGFEAATGDILLILDADLTVRPEDLPKFYQAIASGRGEFINGCRLVYPLEKNSMRFLNILGNKFFGVMFSWLLNQTIKDTLCGTKALWKEDYEKIKQARAFFGDFDPFGDFDLLFGASKLNLKIVDLPIRYQERVYGQTNIQRFKHGWLLLKMCFFAMRKIKFI